MPHNPDEFSNAGYDQLASMLVGSAQSNLDIELG
ncbi:hypothetical protein PAMH27_5875 [Pseudomonas aeruginosa MH27]|nr:hypothetical protein PAMH27_5875 [Pseudomonas aeruginosa MH27]